MKVAICDVVYNLGHVTINEKIVDIMSSICDVVVLDDGHYYRKLNKKVERVVLNVCNKSGAFTGRIQYYKNLMLQYKYLKKHPVDKIFVMTNEFISMSFVAKKLAKLAPVYIIEHNPSELDNCIKYRFFNRYKNRVNHIVLDDFMIQDLVHLYGVKKENIRVINHPVLSIEKKAEIDENLFISLSGSNEEGYVNEFCELVKRKKPFDGTDIKVIMKSKQLQFEDDHVKISNQYLQKEVYDHYFATAKASIILLPESFNCRVSGIAFDTLSSRKILIGNDRPCIRSLKNKYPHNVILFADIYELIDIIKKNNYISNEDECKKFFESNGDAALRSTIRSIVNEGIAV